MDLKEILTKNEAWVFLTIVVAVLIIANALLLMQPQQEKGKETQLLKQFGEETHAGLADRVAELKELKVEIGEDLNADEKIRLKLLEKFYNSAVEDFEWVYEKETENYSKLIASQDKNEALELASKELAFVFLQATITVINHSGIKEGLEEDKNQTIESAESYKDSINVQGLALT